MRFRLFFKDYDCKFNLKSMKQFEEATGKDLWPSLMLYIHTFSVNQDQGTLVLIDKLSKVLTFSEAAHAFHCLASQCNSKVTIEEIEDAMFHAGIRPSERHDDMSEPWPLIMYRLCIDIDNYHTKAIQAKKPAADS